MKQAAEYEKLALEAIRLTVDQNESPARQAIEASKANAYALLAIASQLEDLEDAVNRLTVVTGSE